VTPENQSCFVPSIRAREMWMGEFFST